MRVCLYIGIIQQLVMMVVRASVRVVVRQPAEDSVGVGVGDWGCVKELEFPLH